MIPYHKLQTNLEAILMNSNVLMQKKENNSCESVDCDSNWYRFISFKKSMMWFYIGYGILTYPTFSLVVKMGCVIAC